MTVSGTQHLDMLDFVLCDRPAGRNIISHAIETIESLRAKLATAEVDLAAERRLLDDAIASRSQLKAERDRLQLILDSRPAINTGLLEAYIEWTQGVYLADMGKAVGHN